jgi:FAD:protein FMN transferase
MPNRMSISLFSGFGVHIKNYSIKIQIIALTLVMLCSLLFLPSACKSPPEKYQETRNMWDTYITIAVYSEDQVSAHEAIEAAFSRMEEIGSAASVYDDASEVFRLNRDGYLDNPSADLLKLIEQSVEYSEITNGAFDITVQPLLDVWSAGLWQESAEVQEKTISETMELVGSDKIEVSGSRISFKKDGMKITLGGVTKGYAAAEALKVLEQKGIEHAMVEVGGDISTLGSKPDGEGWQIGLVNPDNPQESLAVFSMKGISVATSGNYERYFSPDKSSSHIVDPRTGYSMSNCISVSIAAESGLQADVLATAVFVMGPEAGLKLVETLDNVEAFIVDNNREIHYSSGIDEYLVESRRGEK